jgi:thymidine phosphorylase
MTPARSHGLTARRLGIDTHAEPVVFLRKDSPVSRSEGFSPHSRILLSAGARQAIATLYQVENGILARDEAGLSNAAWHLLGLNEGDSIKARHAPPVASLSAVRGRIYGKAFDETTLHEIISDIVAGRYSDIEIACFLTASAAKPLSHPEICALTRAMVNTGDRLSWKAPLVADKHSLGGLPGNRTTPIIVSICAELGLVMPKTSSRAITSPAGTADMMETLAPVALGEDQVRAVVTQEGACIVWGGGIDISPADDILIGIERALDIDCEGQMIASVLSKKIAAGATHLVVDMPVGATAKVRTPAAARALSAGLEGVAKSFGLEIRVLPGDGTQPIGRGIGPALEARDVLAVLRGDKTAPQDLRSRALELAGALLEISGKADAGMGVAMATTVLDDGRAWRKFQRICEAQGGMRTPPLAGFRKDLTATAEGIVTAMDNRRIARLAKLAGAPEDRAAGIEMHIRIGDTVARGTPICTLHAESAGELAYALAYADANADMFRITQP